METSSLLSDRLHKASSTDLNTGFSALSLGLVILPFSGKTVLTLQDFLFLLLTPPHFTISLISFSLTVPFPALLFTPHRNCPPRLAFSLSAISRLPHLPLSQPARFIQFFYLPISSTYDLLNFPNNEGGRILWIIGALIKATELWRKMPQFQICAIYYDCRIFYFENWNTKFWT